MKDNITAINDGEYSVHLELTSQRLLIMLYERLQPREDYLFEFGEGAR